ncbi:MAG: ABC transporter permease [Lachnospiraceae bacterium]|nr:ABC transporter permease [Lachnospiraceae bacterium]
MADESKTVSGKKGDIAVIKKLVPFLGLIGLFIIFAATTDGKFLRATNLTNIISQACVIMIASIGCCFVMAHNNLDFSLGGTCALCAVAAVVAGNLVSAWLVFPICLLVGAFCGFLTGILHVKAKIPAFMAGMCIMFIGRGVAQGTYQILPMRIPASLKIFQELWFYLIVLVVVFVVSYIIFEYTKIGKYNKLIGSNPKCAKLSGIKVDKYKVIAFIISGIIVGIAAFVTIIRGGGAGAQTGNSLETNALLALTLGGIPLAGGSATKMRSALIGGLTLFILNNGLTLWGIDPTLIYIVKGVVFLAVVFISVGHDKSKVMA